MTNMHEVPPAIQREIVEAFLLDVIAAVEQIRNGGAITPHLETAIDYVAYNRYGIDFATLLATGPEY